MSAPSKGVLSEAMVKAIAAARDGGTNRLYRWPGGYWMPRRRAAAEYGAIGAWSTTPTVRALIRKGMLKEIAHMSRGDPWIVELAGETWKLINPADIP